MYLLILFIKNNSTYFPPFSKFLKPITTSTGCIFEALIFSALVRAAITLFKNGVFAFKNPNLYNLGRYVINSCTETSGNTASQT